MANCPADKDIKAATKAFETYTLTKTLPRIKAFSQKSWQGSVKVTSFKRCCNTNKYTVSIHPGNAAKKDYGSMIVKAISYDIYHRSGPYKDFDVSGGHDINCERTQTPHTKLSNATDTYQCAINFDVNNTILMPSPTATTNCPTHKDTHTISREIQTYTLTHTLLHVKGFNQKSWEGGAKITSFKKCCNTYKYTINIGRGDNKENDYGSPIVSAISQDITQKNGPYKNASHDHWISCGKGKFTYPDSKPGDAPYTYQCYVGFDVVEHERPTVPITNRDKDN